MSVRFQLISGNPATPQRKNPSSQRIDFLDSSILVEICPGQLPLNYVLPITYKITYYVYEGVTSVQHLALNAKVLLALKKKTQLLIVLLN